MKATKQYTLPSAARATAPQTPGAALRDPAIFTPVDKIPDEIRALDGEIDALLAEVKDLMRRRLTLRKRQSQPF